MTNSRASDSVILSTVPGHRTPEQETALRRIEELAPGDELVRLVEWLEEENACLRGITRTGGHIRKLAEIPDVYSYPALPVSYAVEHLIPHPGVTLISAAPGVGKTWFALAVAIACCQRNEFIGRTCEPTKVLYLDRENSLAVVRERLNSLSAGPAPGLHIWGNWVSEEPPMIGDPRLLDIAKTEHPLLIFDSLVRFHTAEENSASEMRTVMRHLRRLADAGSGVIALHHRSKSDGSKYRGSTDILAAVDMAYALEGNGGLLRLSCYKSRFGPEADIALEADLSCGRFTLFDSHVSTQLRDYVTVLASTIVESPGMTQKEIIQKAHISRTEASRLLRLHEGKLWRTQRGSQNSIRYFPVTCTEYGPVPGIPDTTEASCTAVPTP